MFYLFILYLSPNWGHFITMGLKKEDSAFHYNKEKLIKEQSYDEIRVRNIKPNVKKQLKAAAVKEGYDCFNDFMRVEITKIRDKYLLKYPELKSVG